MKRELLISLMFFFAVFVSKAQSGEPIYESSPFSIHPSAKATAKRNSDASPVDNKAKGRCHDVSCMSQTDFSNALNTIKSEGFDESKLSTAKQVAESNCLSPGQISEICKSFGFEETKLSFAKLAYEHCTEPENYFKLNSIFGFSSNVDELNKYVESRE